MPKLIFFDLDGTLAVSKSNLSGEMARLLSELLHEAKVCIVSGGALPQFLEQVVAQLPDGANLDNLYIEPTSGAALYEYRKGEWHKIYEERIPDAVAQVIMAAAQAGAEATKLIDFTTFSWGPRIEFRGSEVTLSALGQKAPPDEKAAWDADKSKRLKIREEIQKRLPKGYEAEMGGATSVDITKAGVNKAYGIHQLCARLGVPEAEALYVGDQLVKGGNDEAAFDTEIETKAVASPEETALLIKSLLPH